jgi:hypothetical protein
MCLCFNGTKCGFHATATKHELALHQERDDLECELIGLRLDIGTSEKKEARIQVIKDRLDDIKKQLR